MSTTAGSRKRVFGIDPSTRKRLIALARRSKSRTNLFTKQRPTEWRPTEVVDPNGLMPNFTTQTAWQFIASRLEAGEEVQVIDLRQPPGKKGYVMKIDLGPDRPRLYVKLEMGSRLVFGRSFHYSEYE